jgi:hypothetical protein
MPTIFWACVLLSLFSSALLHTVTAMSFGDAHLNNVLRILHVFIAVLIDLKDMCWVQYQHLEVVKHERCYYRTFKNKSGL